MSAPGTPNDAPPLLLATGLVVGHGQPLLHGVDLALRPSEAWFVLGRNGSGKTTLVATLLGLVTHFGGTLQLAEGLRARLGYVPQEQRFDPPLPCTVAEFVTFGIDDGRSRQDVRRSVALALAELRVEDLAGRDVRRLSAGQRRRVLVARAMARRPRLLVLDEPLANLDRGSAVALAQDLERQRANGLCLVHVAHDLAVARDHATHVALVDAGTVTTGTAAAMLAMPTVQALFPGGGA